MRLKDWAKQHSQQSIQDLKIKQNSIFSSQVQSFKVKQNSISTDSLIQCSLFEQNKHIQTYSFTYITFFCTFITSVYSFLILCVNCCCKLHHELWQLFHKAMICFNSYTEELQSVIYFHEEMIDRWRSVICHWDISSQHIYQWLLLFSKQS